MQRDRIRPLVILSFIFLCLSLTINAYAVDSKKQGYMITSFINNDDIVQDEAIHYEVHVSTIELDNPSETIKDAENAKVLALFSQGDQLIKKQLTKSEAGLYRGQVTLPHTGEWQILLVATDQAMSPNLQSEGIETLKTTWEVKKKAEPHYGLWIAGVAVLAAIIYFLARMKRRA